MLNFGLKSRTNFISSFISLILLLPAAYKALPLAAGAPAQGQAGSANIVWLTSLESGFAAGRKTGKPVLVDFSATWCGPCQAMIHDTFPNPSIALILKNFVCVRVDVDQDQADAVKYNVDAIPRILLLSPGASSPPRMDVTGYEDPDTFEGSLRAALGMAPAPGSGSGEASPSISSPAETVEQALQSNTYLILKGKNGMVADQGLKDLITELGQPESDQVIPITPDLLRRAGADADNALVAEMSSKTLSQRVGSYSMFRRLHPRSNWTFDPWADTTARKHRLELYTL